MILPIYLYGQGVLRQETAEVPEDYPEFKPLLDNMYETLVKAEGVGLAAPQVGLALRLFVVDLRPMADEEPKYKDYTKTFVNPEIVEYSEEKDTMEEGCLSIPGIHENVSRSTKVRIHYLDENFVAHEEVFEGFEARVIQHEYDHLEGKVFTDRISPIRKQLIKSRITNILKGRVACDYRVKTTRK